MRYPKVGDKVRSVEGGCLKAGVEFVIEEVFQHPQTNKVQYLGAGFWHNVGEIEVLSDDTETIYQKNGFANRQEYLEELASEYGDEIVFAMADVLGEEEDFDGLISSLEDMDMM